MWADREEMSPMDTQNVAGNYNETGSFPTASSIHNYAETPRSSLYSYRICGTLIAVTPGVRIFRRGPAVRVLRMIFT